MQTCRSLRKHTEDRSSRTCPDPRNVIPTQNRDFPYNIVYPCSATPLSLISKKRIPCLSTRFKLLATCWMFFRQNGRSFHIGVMTVKVSVISLRAFPGKSAMSSPPSCYKDLPNLLDRSRQSPLDWVYGEQNSGSGVLAGIMRVFEVQSASIASCLKKMNFFNLLLASHRLLCYNKVFSGEYSFISQEYPPIN